MDSFERQVSWVSSHLDLGPWFQYRQSSLNFFIPQCRRMFKSTSLSSVQQSLYIYIYIHIHIYIYTCIGRISRAQIYYCIRLVWHSFAFSSAWDLNSSPGCSSVATLRPGGIPLGQDCCKTNQGLREMEARNADLTCKRRFCKKACLGKWRNIAK